MREERAHRIEVHVAGICIDIGRVLIAKRSPSRKLYPVLWECGGGQVKAGESFEEAVERQLREELGVLVLPMGVVGTYRIVHGKERIPGVRFRCEFLKYANGKGPQLSAEHTEWKWVTKEDLNTFDFIPGVDEDIKEAIKRG